MQNRLIRVPSVLIALLMIISVSAPTYAASEKTITKDFYFEVDNPDAISYTVDQDEIEIDGKHYRLKDVKCDLYSQPITEKKSLKSKDKNAEPYITRTVEGTEIKLYAPANIEWKDNGTEYKQEYKKETDAPQTLVVEDKELSLKSVEHFNRTDPVSTTAYFYSEDPEAEEYEFNGKMVTLSDGRPIWNGYKGDYAEYLGIANNNDYSITGSSWSSGPQERADGTYVRSAMIYGTKKVNYVVATYGPKDGDARYTADVTYTSKYIGHATTTYERYMSLKEKLMYAGAGVGVLALAAALILFAIGKRRKAEEE